MIKRYLKTAYRKILNYKLQSLLNISGLTIGLLSIMAIYLYVTDELSYDKHNKNHSDIYRLIIGYQDQKIAINNWEYLDILKQQLQPIKRSKRSKAFQRGFA